ncbi:radical SAM protein [candidate division WOR-3 bacterium]|nr:radical SAM protein [candidate division WOR-3 bacterium]
MKKKINSYNYFFLATRKFFTKDFPPDLYLLCKTLTVLITVFLGERRRRKKQEAYNTPVPHVCILSVTWKCNLNCLGCYARHYPKENQIEMNDVERILEQAKDLGIYIFIVVGGEPLLFPSLVEKLSEKKDILFFLFTNGSLLDREKTIRIKKARNIIPVLSWDGDDSYIDHRRGFGMGEKVSKALSLFKENNVAFGFSCMITHKNLNDVLSYKYADSLLRFGAKFGFIIDYIPMPKTFRGELILDEDDIKIKRMKIQKLNKRAGITFFSFPEDEYKKPGCMSAGNGFIHINANGNVEPCPFSHYAVDNIRDKSILDILNSEFFKQLRNTFHDKENPLKNCMLFQHDDIVRKIAWQTNAFCTERQ